jgi:hypothetical protein
MQLRVTIIERAKKAVTFRRVVIVDVASLLAVSVFGFTQQSLEAQRWGLLSASLFFAILLVIAYFTRYRNGRYRFVLTDRISSSLHETANSSNGLGTAKSGELMTDG